jgi:hypothetical protein
MNKKTTSINSSRSHPLQVEWLDYNAHPGSGRYRMLPDGKSKRLPGEHVSLLHPGYPEHTEGVRILNLDPRTALNLLAWLEAERDTLLHLAAVWEEAERA